MKNEILTTGGEEFFLGFLVSLGHEERRWTEAPPAFGTGVNLVVEQVMRLRPRWLHCHESLTLVTGRDLVTRDHRPCQTLSPLPQNMSKVRA